MAVPWAMWVCSVCTGMALCSWTGVAWAWVICCLVWVLVSCTRGWWTVWWVLMGPWISWVPKVGMFLKMGWAKWVVLTMGAGWWVAIGAGIWVWMVSATGWVRVEIWGVTSAKAWASAVPWAMWVCSVCTGMALCSWTGVA